MTVKIVLDACSLIDLDLPHVQLIDTLIEFLKEKRNYEVMISEVNFNEITNNPHSQMKRKLTQSGILSIKKPDITKFEAFSDRLNKELHITIQTPDRHVLFAGVQNDATFISTSDTRLYYKINTYRDKERIRDKNKIFPISTPGLLKILYDEKMIESDVYFEKCLQLFKFKEIKNFFDHMVTSKLKVEGQERVELIDDYIETLKERFQTYKDPVVDEYKNLKRLGCIKV